MGKTKHISKWSLMLIIESLILSTLIAPALSKSLGVKVGSWAKYNLTFEYTWLSEEPVPSYLQEAKDRDWNNVTIVDINGTTVMMEVVTHSKNGTTFTTMYEGDVLLGVGNFTFPLLLMANLSEGEPIVEHEDAPVINKTVSKSFAGANRNVNFIPVLEGNVIWNQTASRYQLQGNGSIRYYYFDRATGILCSFELLSKEITASYGLLIRMDIVIDQTNLWAAEINWWIFPLISVIIIAVPTALYFLRTRKKKRLITRHLKKNRKKS